MNLSVGSVLLFAPVVAAVQHEAKVRLMEYDGEIVEGTLRAFTRRENTSAHLRSADNLSNAWIHITTTGGFERWFEALFVATQHAEGVCSFE